VVDKVGFMQPLDTLGIFFVGRVQRIQFFGVDKFEAQVFQSANSIRNDTKM